MRKSGSATEWVEGADPAAARPWLASYQPGVRDEIDAGGLQPIPSLFAETVRRYPGRSALESFGVRMSYEQLGRHAGAVASWLAGAGVVPGDRVGIMLPNVMAYPAILFGALAAGAAVVSINPLYTPPELERQLADTVPRVLFVLENFAATAAVATASAPVERVVVVTPGDLLGAKGVLVNLVSRIVKRAVPAYRLPDAAAFTSVLAAGRGRPAPPVTVGLDDIAFLQPTGGTTGTPKSAVLTHRNVVANVAQTELVMAPTLGTDVLTMVTALPLYHIFALTVCCLVIVARGGCQILIANPRDIPGFVKTLRTRPFTCLSGVNTLYNALLNAPGIRAVDFSRLTLAVAGGMATQEVVARGWRELTGRPIVEGYGLSETSPIVTANRLDIAAFTGTVGYPVPSTDISVRDEAGRSVAVGEPGELCVRGPQVMRGYWNRPDETARATTADGFFRTGDLACLMPDGAIRIVDRLKDLILVSGFNVFPNEVEGVLASCPGVAEVAVLGVPSGASGEEVVACVVRSDPGLEAASLLMHARASLTGYKVPRRILFRDTLPKSNVGKVLRRVLRDEIARETPRSA